MGNEKHRINYSGFAGSALFAARGATNRQDNFVPKTVAAKAPDWDLAADSVSGMMGLAGPPAGLPTGLGPAPEFNRAHSAGVGDTIKVFGHLLFSAKAAKSRRAE